MNKDTYGIYEKIVEEEFKKELLNYFDYYEIKLYWKVKFTEYNPAYNGCSFQVRYLNTKYNDKWIQLYILFKNNLSWILNFVKLFILNKL